MLLAMLREEMKNNAEEGENEKTYKRFLTHILSHPSFCSCFLSTTSNFFLQFFNTVLRGGKEEEKQI
jgi:hypothetical protein